RTRGFILGVNIGYHFRKRVVFRDLVVDDEVRISVGALFPLWRERISLSAEANLALGVLAYTAGGTRSQSLDTPVELVSLLRYRDRSGFVVGVGGGVALGPGYGAADFRLLLRLAYHFERPRPLRTSRKPNKGSAPPKAPPVPPFIVERPLSAKDIDLLARNNGDRDGDGIPDAHDKCPDQPEDFDGFEDDDGCPDPDNDQDGIPDHLDKCPNQPETFNGIDDDDGCPDKGPALTIEIKGGEIVLGRAIFFRTGSDQLDKRSNAILDRLAQLLRARWDIRLLAIEGHTDNRGDPDQNVDLSQRRANRVRDYLVGKGIAGFRMRPKGFGAKKPIAANDSDANRAKNRRVVFRILTRRGGSK
ncbi:MAG: OmpA family protein, partial [Myxococcales bacterium]|nr:OmpA family protein [Myxococcales bacterium]